MVNFYISDGGLLASARNRNPLHALFTGALFENLGGLEQPCHSAVCFEQIAIAAGQYSSLVPAQLVRRNRGSGLSGGGLVEYIVGHRIGSRKPCRTSLLLFLAMEKIADSHTHRGGRHWNVIRITTQFQLRANFSR